MLSSLKLKFDIFLLIQFHPSPCQMLSGHFYSGKVFLKDGRGRCITSFIGPYFFFLHFFSPRARFLGPLYVNFLRSFCRNAKYLHILPPPRGISCADATALSFALCYA